MHTIPPRCVALQFFNTHGMAYRDGVSMGGRLTQKIQLDSEKLGLIGNYNDDKAVKNILERCVDPNAMEEVM